jgi:hypothetical protein
MVAFMDAEALDKTRDGAAHFYSRAPRQIVAEGETSGHFLRVEIRVDCDQDALLHATPKGRPATPARPVAFIAGWKATLTRIGSPPAPRRRS